MAITDDFNRADWPNLGDNWTFTVVGMSIVGNTARPAGAGYNFSFYSAVSWIGDHSSQAKFLGGIGADMEITVRNDGDSNDNYMLMVNSGSGVTRIYKYVGGGFTQLVDFSVAPTNDRTYKLDVTGTTLKAYENGVQLGTDLIDGSLSGGAPGIGGSSTSAGNWDDWVGTGELAGGGRTFVLTRL